MTVLGRFAYSWPSNDRPARLDAALTAPEIDIDRVHALAKAMLGDTEFDRPREGTLSLKIGRASVAGIEAKGADISMRLDANGLDIERLAIADFGGAALAVKGRIDTRSQSPRGAVTLDLDARALDGIVALIDKFAPRTAEQLRRSADRVTPVSVARVAFGRVASPPAAPTRPPSSRSTAAPAASGSRCRATRARRAMRSRSTTWPRSAPPRSSSPGGSTPTTAARWLELIGLDRLVAVDKRPGRLNLNASGPLERRSCGRWPAGRPARSISRRTGWCGCRMARARPRGSSSRSPMPMSARRDRSAAGRPAELLPASLTARLGLAEGTVSLTDVAGTVAGTSVGGTARDRPAAADAHRRRHRARSDRPSGRDRRGDRDAGAERRRVATWSGEPFEPRLAAGLNGQVAIKSARVALTPKLAARDVRGVLNFDGPELALQDIDGDAGRRPHRRRAHVPASRRRT